jgi:hypothetical protein
LNVARHLDHVLAHATVIFHFGGEEKLGSFVPLRPGLRGKNRLETSDYLKSTHLLKAFLQIRLHGIEHATLDQGGVIHLRLVDILLIRGGIADRRIAYGAIKNIGHLMRCEEDPQSAEPCGEVQTISLKFFFLKECA